MRRVSHYDYGANVLGADDISDAIPWMKAIKSFTGGGKDDTAAQKALEEQRRRQEAELQRQRTILYSVLAAVGAGVVGVTAYLIGRRK